jgi:hypothetical protein
MDSLAIAQRFFTCPVWNLVFSEKNFINIGKRGANLINH